METAEKSQLEKLDQLRRLEAGKKYTLVGFSEFGFPYQIQMKLIGVRYEPYAQYADSYLLIFKREGGRKECMIRFYDIKQFIIWDGYVYPTTDMYVKRNAIQYAEGKVDTMQSWVCFDPRYMERAIMTVDQPPFIQNIKVKDLLEARENAREDS